MKPGTPAHKAVQSIPNATTPPARMGAPLQMLRPMLLVVLLFGVVASACQRHGQDSAQPGRGVPPTSNGAPASVADARSSATESVVQPESSASPPPSRGPAPKAAAVPPPTVDENASEDLVEEEHELNPRSEKVKISLTVEPARAKVYWGIKCLGTSPLELERPRQSGPMDLTIEAPGFLRYHTRVFTDRDDKLTVHLVPDGAGSRVFGYRPPVEKQGDTRGR